MNVFRQEIGIWFQSLDWAFYIFDTIVEECKNSIWSCSKRGLYIELIDGSAIHFFRLGDKNAPRGRKFSMAFIDVTDGVNCKLDQFIETDIRSRTFGPMYKVREYEDFQLMNRRRYL